MTQSKRALIGHTGFVGSNLQKQQAFDGYFNSKNFLDLRGTEWDEIVCAGISAVKWKANKEPEVDRANIAKLEDVLREVEARRFLLISTIDVYPAAFQQVDESFDPRPHENHAYGRHRLEFEDFIGQTFGDGAHVFRLPALFGEGLKKNVLYDLLNDNCLPHINPETEPQWYSLERLSGDMEKAVAAGIKLSNLMTEPFPTARILESFFSDKEVGSDPWPVGKYDIYTQHAEVFGGKGHYIESADEVLERMGRFIEQQRGRS